MKNKLSLLHIGLLLLFAKASFAQELQHFYSKEFQDPHGYIDNMIYLDQDRILVWTYEDFECYLTVLDNDGSMIDSIHVYSFAPQDEFRIRNTTPEYLADGTIGFFLLTFTGDTAHMQRINIKEDLSLTYQDYFWESTDVALQESSPTNPINWLVNKDGSVLFTYLVEDSKEHPTDDKARLDALQLVKFNDKGVIMIDTVMFHDFDYFNNYPRYHLLPTPDSLGYRLILSGRPDLQFDIFDCYTLDANLNIVAVNQNIDQLSYPLLCGCNAFLRMNPYNGKTYSISSSDEIIPHPSGPEYTHTQDALMSVFDANNFEQLNYIWGITTPTYTTGGYEKSIDFDDEGGVYIVTGMDQNYFFSTSLYFVYLDEDLNKHCELYLRPDYGFEYCYTGGICVGPNGDVLIRCNHVTSNSFDYKQCIFRIPSSAFDGIEEAHDAGLAVATAYPNPGGNILNIRTALQNAHVEVYDVSGRLMHSQALTENVTAIDATDWADGVYVWKVYQASPSTLRVSSGNTGSGTLAETGKWIKEH